MIKYLVMDIDGTLTDGKIYMGNSGEVMKAFSVKDGLAISNILSAEGIQPIVITGRGDKNVENRCKELGIKDCFQGISDKLETLEEHIGQDALGACAYFGDDIPDLACMERIRKEGGVVGCPADSAQGVIRISNYVCKNKSGEGALREFVEWLLDHEVAEPSEDQETRKWRIELRFQEFIEELNNCRQDERDAQNQILQVIVIVCTVLGILFGTSYLMTDESGYNRPIVQIGHTLSNSFFDKAREVCALYITPARAVFVLGITMFCVAFLYLIFLGVGNILRFYYIQEIEDRIAGLMMEETEILGKPEMPVASGISEKLYESKMGTFVHWNSFSAPIQTKNIRHISSSQTFLNYVVYFGAMTLALLFSMGVVGMLYLKINPIQPFDKVALSVFVVTLLITVVMYVRYCNHSERVVEFSRETAQVNQKIRLQSVMSTCKEGSASADDQSGGLFREKTYDRAEYFWRVFGYLLYPSIKDLQKVAVTVLGFLFGIWFLGRGMATSDAKHLVIVLFVFEFLAYQARYQINDIRGMDAYEENGRTKWMAKYYRVEQSAKANEKGDTDTTTDASGNAKTKESDVKVAKEGNGTGKYQDKYEKIEEDKRHFMKISAIIALARIAVAFWITMRLEDGMRQILFLSLLILTFSSIAYEVARNKGNKFWIFALVGVGYPLRFFLGYFVAVSGSLNFMGWEALGCIAFALLLYGSFSSILAWIWDIVEIVDSHCQKGSLDSKRQRGNLDRFPDSYGKSHYNYLQGLIKSRYNKVASTSTLREKAEWKDPWVWMLIAAMTLLAIAGCLGETSVCHICMDVLTVLTLGLLFCCAGKDQRIPFFLCWGLLFINFFCETASHGFSVFNVMILFLQLLITATYFILAYRPQFRKVSIRKIMSRFFLFIFGKNIEGIF